MSDVFDVILKQLAAEKEPVSKSILAGAPVDYAKYQLLCGQIRGLSVAEQAVKDLAKKYREDDDE
jgi:hypothetical protein